VEFRTEKEFEINRVALPAARLADLEQHLVLVFTGIKRKASDVVAKQLNRIDLNLSALRSMGGNGLRGP